MSDGVHLLALLRPRDTQSRKITQFQIEASEDYFPENVLKFHSTNRSNGSFMKYIMQMQKNIPQSGG